MPANQYLPWATGGGANVEDPTAYAAEALRALGHQAGVAKSAAVNTTLRQTSVAVAALAQKIADVTGADVLDDGSVVNFEAGLTAMLSLLGGLGSGGMFGLILSNAVSSPTTKITIATGQCRDSTNSNNLILAAPITKDLTAAWAAGTNNGGRDTGSLANAQTWHVFLILNPTTLALDALFSQSPTAPTLPAGFTKFRRLGAVLLDAAATTIRLFVQKGDRFKLKTRSVDFAAQANGGGVAYLRKISVPNGINVRAEIYFQSTGTISASTAYFSGIFDPDFGVPPAYGPSTQWAQVRRVGVTDSSGGTADYGTTMINQDTDTAQNIYTFSNDTADVIALGVVSWTDDRGRFF